MQQEWFAAMALDKVDGRLAEDIGQVAFAPAIFNAPVAIQPVAVIGIPAALKANKLLIAARCRMIAPVERAVVPLANQAGRVAGSAKDIAHGRFVQAQAVQTARLQRVDAAGALGIAPGHQGGARGRANW